MKAEFYKFQTIREGMITYMAYLEDGRHLTIRMLPSVQSYVIETFKRNLNPIQKISSLYTPISEEEFHKAYTQANTELNLTLLSTRTQTENEFIRNVHLDSDNLDVRSW